MKQLTTPARDVRATRARAQLITTAASAALALAAAGCGSEASASEFTIVAGETKAEPFDSLGYAFEGQDVTTEAPTINVSVGEPVSITLINDHGQYAPLTGSHDLAVVPQIDDLFTVIATDKIADHVLWDAATSRIHSGETTQIEFIPDTTGTYQYLCTIPGHAMGGMMGTLIVGNP